ncbi:hypothetical protein [Serratia aquatilis]|uniref:YjcQ protein n=1 Tax=Serratia aquatilis TaxID=1737515 RepID=A0ABV6EEG7_9GAMM
MDNSKEIYAKILQSLFETHGINQHMENRKKGIEIAGDEQQYNDAVSYLASRRLLITVETFPIDGSPKRFYPVLTKEGFEGIKRFGAQAVLDQLTHHKC